MTLSTVTNRINYPGAGSVGPFAIPFRFFAAADLLLTKRAATGVETTLAYGPDFTVTGIGDATGTATLTTALAVGEFLAVRRAPALTQPTSIRNQGAYFPATIEDEFDRLTMQLQSLSDRLQRTFGVSESYDPATLALLLKPETGKALVWQSSTQLGNSSLDSNAVALPGNGRTTTSLSTYLLNDSFFNLLDYAPVGYVAGVTDAIAMINAATAAAVAAGKHAVFAPAADYLCDSARIIIPQGITIFCPLSMGEYDGNPYTHGARFIRSAAGLANQPIVQLSTSSACVGVELRWQKAGGALQGVLRMGEAGSFITYSTFKGAIRGTRTGDITGATTCYGIKFPDTADAKFFNDIDAYVTECDVSCRLGQMANGNFIKLLSRESHLHLELNALAGQAIENTIDVRMFAITVLAPAWGIKMRNAINNRIRGVYEAYGTCFDVDATADPNNVDVVVNEANPSYLPGGSDRRFARAVNNQQYASLTFPTRVTGDRNTFGRGNKVTFFKDITGTLPNVNDATGTLTAAGLNNRVLINLGGNFNKAGLISFKAKLGLWAYVPFNHAMQWVEVEFTYRNTNQSTGAGQLSVTKVTQKGGDITGLFFLTGVTGGTNFEIALVMGNLGSATPPDVISCELDITALTYSTNVITMDNIASQVSFATRAVTANDVLNKISLLTVADTAV